MNDDTRLDTSDIPCPVKGHGGYYGSNCEMCEIESLQASLLTAQGQLKELKGCARTALKEYFDGENKNWVEDVRNKMDTLDNLLTQLDKTQK